jgi:CheY-like chemotaxis protein
MRRFLERLGYHVDCAGEREEAEALLVTAHYDLLIADLRLSDAETAEGLELVHFARRLAPDIQTVILTAFGSPSIERLAFERGVTAFLQKPQPLATIADVVASALSSASPGPRGSDVGDPRLSASDHGASDRETL